MAYGKLNELESMETRMTPTKPLSAALIALVLLTAGCAEEKKNPVERAVDSTKDALDVRPNEKLKDAGENVKDAVENAGEGVKDAVNGKK